MGGGIEKKKIVEIEKYELEKTTKHYTKKKTEKCCTREFWREKKNHHLKRNRSSNHVALFLAFFGGA